MLNKQAVSQMTENDFCTSYNKNFSSTDDFIKFKQSFCDDDRLNSNKEPHCEINSVYSKPTEFNNNFKNDLLIERTWKQKKNQYFHTRENLSHHSPLELGITNPYTETNSTFEEISNHSTLSDSQNIANFTKFASANNSSFLNKPNFSNSNNVE